jgi:large subunit ribosomal protein L10e
MKYIHGAPVSKVQKFTMGDSKATYQYKVSLVAESRVQVRHNALEAARVSANKVMADKLGETGYLIKVVSYPHVILRENRMIATAGADRLQEGMRRSFGKPNGRAAIIELDGSVLNIYVNESGLEHAKVAMKVSSSKLPMACRVSVEKIESQAASLPAQPA